MITWIAPGSGMGHATRAAAIARHLTNPVTVQVETELANSPLYRDEIPHEVRSPRMMDPVSGSGPTLLVGDYDPADRRLTHLQPDVWVWRYGRSRVKDTTPVLIIEGPGSCWPIVGLDAHEILNRDAARAELGVQPDQSLVVGVPSVSAPGLVELQSDVTFVLDRWPALRWLAAADQVVGCPGANLWAEVGLLGLPARWFAAPNRPDQIARINSPVGSVIPAAALRAAEAIDRLADGLGWDGAALGSTP